MTADEFRTRCVLAGYATVHAVAHALGVSPRQVDRYRAGECIPPHVERALSLLEQLQAAHAELTRHGIPLPKPATHTHTHTQQTRGSSTGSSC
jgi:hypothetical protein